MGFGVLALGLSGLLEALSLASGWEVRGSERLGFRKHVHMG